MLSQYKGVSYHRGNRKWIAQSQRRSKKVYARFETEDLLAVGILGNWIVTCLRVANERSAFRLCIGFVVNVSDVAAVARFRFHSTC
jgi:hypothetical protein